MAYTNKAVLVVRFDEMLIHLDQGMKHSYFSVKSC